MKYTCDRYVWNDESYWRLDFPCEKLLYLLKASKVKGLIQFQCDFKFNLSFLFNWTHGVWRGMNRTKSCRCIRICSNLDVASRNVCFCRLHVSVCVFVCWAWSVFFILSINKYRRNSMKKHSKKNQPTSKNKHCNFRMSTSTSINLRILIQLARYVIYS